MVPLVVRTRRVQVELWRGGCPRPGFVFTVDSKVGVHVRIEADDTVALTGLRIRWRTLAAADGEVDEVINIVPCPELVGQACGGPSRGTCTGPTGVCLCESRWFGEDCTSPIWCPGPELCEFLHTLVIVAPNGDDNGGSIGYPGIPKRVVDGGLPPKPVKSLARAVQLVNIWGVIIVYPGLYHECGAELHIDNVRIMSLTSAEAPGFGDVKFDCHFAGRWLSTDADNTVVRPHAPTPSLQQARPSRFAFDVVRRSWA